MQNADAVSLTALLANISAGHRGELIEKGAIHRTVDSPQDIQLLPDHIYAETIRKNIRNIRPNVLAESLILVKTDVSDDDFLTLYNALRKVSVLNEVTFINLEKNRVRDLFDSSYKIDDPKKRNPLPDDSVTTMPSYSSFYVLQEFSHFGEVVSLYEFDATENSFLFTGINQTPVPFKIFNPVRAGNMVTHLLVIAEVDFILVYGIGASRVFNPFGLLSGVVESRFNYRTQGLFLWFQETYLSKVED